MRFAAVIPGWSKVLAGILFGGLMACQEAAAPPGATVAPPGRFARADIEYLAEVALGAEYGDQAARLRKWTRPVRVGAVGAPQPGDLAFLDSVIEQVNGLQAQIRLSRPARGPYDIWMHFEPRARFAAIEPNYVPGDPSFFWVWWTSEYEIDEARILIAIDDEPRQRKAYILEELVQSLGLTNSPPSRPDSIFADLKNSHRTELAPIDRRLIAMLYRPELWPGMTREELWRVLEAL